MHHLKSLRSPARPRTARTRPRSPPQNHLAKENSGKKRSQRSSKKFLKKMKTISVRKASTRDLSRKSTTSLKSIWRISKMKIWFKPSMRSLSAKTPCPGSSPKTTTKAACLALAPSIYLKKSQLLMMTSLTPLRINRWKTRLISNKTRTLYRMSCSLKPYLYQVLQQTSWKETLCWVSRRDGQLRSRQICREVTSNVQQMSHRFQLGLPWTTVRNAEGIVKKDPVRNGSQSLGPISWTI